VRKPKKNKGLGRLASVGILVILIGIAIYYFYSADQGQIRGLQFGNELKAIQDGLELEQSEYYSNVSMWQEGSISKEEILQISEVHIVRMNEIVTKYADLQIPDTFSGAVKLYKLSTESQLESDIHLINWIEFGDESEKIRSDELLQQSFEYELAALTSFNDAKKGNP